MRGKYFRHRKARETGQALQNLSNTTAVSTYYRNAVDEAVSAVQAGIEDYNTAIRRVVREAGQAGLRVVDASKVIDYESGYSRRLDTAARMNVLDGTRHLNQSIAEEIGHQFGADGVEISAHMLCAEDHAPYQGGQYTNEEFEELQDSLERPFGEWNCRHSWHPIILGISEPAYTQEQLTRYREYSAELIDIDGRTKTRYEWSQEMRRCETAVRHQKDVANLAKASGDTTLRRQAQMHINALNERYEYIANTAGLVQEPERMSVAGFRRVKAENGLTNQGAADRIKLPDSEIFRSLGAAARNYDILGPDDETIYRYVEGTKIQNREVFAGYRTKTPLKPEVAEGLTAQFGGSAEKWQHVKGNGIIEDDGVGFIAQHAAGKIVPGGFLEQAGGHIAGIVHAARRPGHAFHDLVPGEQFLGGDLHRLADGVHVAHQAREGGGDDRDDLVSSRNGQDDLADLALVCYGAKRAVDETLATAHALLVVDVGTTVLVGSDGLHATRIGARAHMMMNRVIRAHRGATTTGDALGVVDEGPTLLEGNRLLWAYLAAGMRKTALACARDAIHVVLAGVAGKLDHVDERRIVVRVGIGRLVEALAHANGNVHVLQVQAHGQAYALHDNGALKKHAFAVCGKIARNDLVRQHLEVGI